MLHLGLPLSLIPPRLWLPATRPKPINERPLGIGRQMVVFFTTDQPVHLHMVEDEKVGPCGCGQFALPKMIMDVVHTQPPVIHRVGFGLGTIELGIAEDADGF